MSKFTLDKQEWYSSEKELVVRKNRLELLKNCPIPGEDLLQNLGLFINSKNMARIMFMNHIYQLSLGVHGVVMEFGCRWGNISALFSVFRGMYEPFNRSRKIVAFDTFSGFPSLHSSKDNLNTDAIHLGGISTTEGYEQYLKRILELNEADNPMSHIERHEVVKGDATKTVKQYFKDYPETIVSLAYFDFDVYPPTKAVLKVIKNKVVKGSIIAFDELSDHDSPGETLALQEVWGLKNVRLQRLPFASRVSYFVVE
jgi:hypothetical protein